MSQAFCTCDLIVREVCYLQILKLQRRVEWSAITQYPNTSSIFAEVSRFLLASMVSRWGRPFTALMSFSRFPEIS